MSPLETLDFFCTSDRMKLGAAALRGVIVAPPGKKLVVADLSNIEGRMLAWVAGEKWKLKAFREYDAGTGPDLYNITANMIIGVDPWKVPKKERNVFGKVPDLACFTATTRVLTDNGVKNIIDVKIEDRVWDGVEWVNHKGLVDQGVHQVVAVAGIEVTPDHLIRTGQTWTPAQQLAMSASTLSRALATGSASLPRPTAPTAPTNAPSKKRNVESTSLKRVYDIAHAGPRTRFTILTDRGYLLVHNSGYRGGVAGYQNFARAYGVKMADHWDTIQQSIRPQIIEKAKENFNKWGYQQLEDLEISELEWIASETCKLAWRARHPATCQLWYDLQDAAISAIKCWGQCFAVGRHLRVMGVTHAGKRWLLIRLPSKRFLTYFNPGIASDGQITYEGEATEQGKTTRMWVTCYTHGGKLTGNCCQALARDILAPSIQVAEEEGYTPILSVHDELLTETPDTEDYTVDGLAKIMSTNPPWSTGLPLAAAGFEAYRYRKD